MNYIKIILTNTGAILAGAVVMILIQQINLMLFPLPSWVDTNNSEHLAQVMVNLPITALLMVELSYILGCITAGALLSLFLRNHLAVSVWVIGSIYTVMGLINLLMVPHPIWLAVLSSVTYIPMVWLGAKILTQLKRV